jgi:hypothetical protein
MNVRMRVQKTGFSLYYYNMTDVRWHQNIIHIQRHLIFSERLDRQQAQTPETTRHQHQKQHLHNKSVQHGLND